MNTSFQRLLGLAFAGQLLFACQKHRDEVPPATEQPATPQPGYFVMSATSHTSSPTGRTTQDRPAAFDLGVLKGSKEFLFMVDNGGDEPIFDITLSSDKEAFEVSPKRIQVLPGKSGTGIVPLISVGIIHGKQLNGRASAPILPKGHNQATIKLVGKTLSKKDTVEVTGEFVLSVEAKVVGLKLLSGGNEIVVSDRVTNEERVFLVSATPIVIVNSGNVALHPVIHYSEGVLPNPIVKVTNEFDIAPGETKDITHLYTMYNPLTYINFSDDGGVLATSISGRDPVNENPKIVLLRR